MHANYKVGQLLTANQDIEVEGVLGTKRTIKKGSKVWIGADDFAHHLDGCIQPLAEGETVEGYYTEGIAERIFIHLAAIFPLQEIGEMYEIEANDVKEEIKYALEELGM